MKTIPWKPKQLEAINGILKFMRKPFRANDPTGWAIVINGFAGTGKTTLVQEAIRIIMLEISDYQVCVSAPTNKATQVLRTFGKEAGVVVDSGTIFSLLGLVLGKEGEVKRCFQGGEGSFDLYHAVVIDEGSMSGSQLMDSIESRASLNHTKVIFMGDNCQLNPVNEGVSRIFNTELFPNVYNLTEMVRQDEGSPIRQTVGHVRDLVDKGIKPPKFVTDLTPEEDGVHILLGGDWLSALLDQFDCDEYRDDPSFCRVLAWTNREVDRLNRKIRQRIYGKNCKAFVVGETIAILAPVFDGNEPVIFTDDECTITHLGTEVIEDKADFDTLAQGHPEYKCWIIQVTLPEGGSHRVIALHEDSKSDYDARCKRLSRKAKTKTGTWKAFWAFHDSFTPVRPCHAMTVHKCVHEDTLVDTAEGKYKIKDLTIGQLVYTKEGIKPITDKVFTGEKQGLKITTSSGRSITCSHEHRMFSSVGGNFPDYLRAEKLKVGDHLAAFEHPVEYKPTDKNGLTQEQCYLVGALIGDGCYSESYRGDHRIDITSPDRVILCAFEAEVKRLGANVGKCKVKPGCQTYYTHSKAIRSQLKNLGLDYVTARNKIIPEYFKLSASIDQRISLISGLIDTDGSFAKDRSMMRFVTSSDQLAKDFLGILQSLGVHSYDLPAKEAHWICVSGASFSRMCNLLKLKVPHKKTLCMLGKTKVVRRENRDIIPFSKLLTKDLSLFAQTLRIPVSTLPGTLVRGTHNKNRHHMLNSLKDNWATFMLYRHTEFLSERFFYDPIVSIEPVGLVPMYDIEVEGDHNFIANGLVSHNSQGQTFNTIFVQAKDILNNHNPKERARLLYVATSRPTTNLVLNVAQLK